MIDWEFAGIKPDIYDAANFVGCAGMIDLEHAFMHILVDHMTEIRDVFSRRT